jgi:hypothetical protein
VWTASPCTLLFVHHCHTPTAALGSPLAVCLCALQTYCIHSKCDVILQLQQAASACVWHSTSVHCSKSTITNAGTHADTAWTALPLQQQLVYDASLCMKRQWSCDCGHTQNSVTHSTVHTWSSKVHKLPCETTPPCDMSALIKMLRKVATSTYPSRSMNTQLVYSVCVSVVSVLLQVPEVTN